MTPIEALEAPPHKTRPTASRNAEIVEGALLADIALVLLLGRVYLPIPVIRVFWRLLACGPFVLLAERRGVRVTIMSGMMAYVLMTALVGPTLALTVLDVSLAAVIIAMARNWQSPRVVTALVGGVIYALLDVVIPTIVFAYILRIPLGTIINDLKHAMNSAVKLGAETARAANRFLASLLGPSAPHLPTAKLERLGHAASAYVVGHWVIFALVAAIVIGVANLAAYELGADVILGQLPREVRGRRAAVS